MCFAALCFYGRGKGKKSFQSVGSYITATLLFFALMFNGFTSQLGIYVWITAFGNVGAMWLNTGTKLDKLVSTFLKSKFLQMLGTLICLIYLSDEVLIRVVMKISKVAVPDTSNMYVLLDATIFSILANFLVSYLIFHGVEAPAIRFGKKLRNREKTQNSTKE